MIDFLLEIGFEEFPPSFLKTSALELSGKVETLLKEKRIFYRSTRTIYTPRCIGILILGLSRKQKSQVTEIQGPPKKVAFDGDGKPTETLLGFMKAHNVKLSQVKVKRIKKGEYLFVKKEAVALSTEDILYEEVPKIIRGLEFPKTMIWYEGGVKFPRPVRWIVALLDRRPLRFEFARVKADRYSMPNQHFSFKPIRLEKPREYINFLRHGGVIVDPNERKRLILKRIKKATEKIEGKPMYTNDMIEEINSTCEYPEVVIGEFDAKYLELPEEILMSVLKTQGNLIWIKGTNKFGCVFSAKKKAVQNVRKGYTHVVSAKLHDAHFFYKNDLQSGLKSMLEQAKQMMWLKDLGSLHDKSTRLEKFVQVFSNVPELDINVVKRAALLCKADLLSQMVKEKDFTSLQGIMGAYYARADEEDPKVEIAIKEHYLPRYVGDSLPQTREGAVLSIADKIDNVIGAFLSGNRPSGSYDPLAVRRNGYAVVKIIDTFSIDISLFDLIKHSMGNLCETLKQNIKDSKKVGEILLDVGEHLLIEFFKERLTRYFQDKKFRYDEINTVFANWQGDITDARMKCEALKKFRGKPEFTKLVIGQKRVRNILRGVKEIGEVNVELFREKTEGKLYQKGRETESQLGITLENKSYPEALNLLLAMRPVIDKFFDDVLVMCEDKSLSNNRLALVGFINRLFLQYADLSQIVIEGEK